MAVAMLKGLVIFTLLMIGIYIYSFVVREIINDIKARKEWNEIRDIRQMIIYEENSWEELVLDEPNNTIECFEAIVDDALCQGFEFKVDNGKVYFREREVE